MRMTKSLRLIDAGGDPVTQDLSPFGPAPEGALALKFADAVSDAEWVTDAERLAELRREDAPLAYVEGSV